MSEPLQRPTGADAEWITEADIIRAAELVIRSAESVHMTALVTGSESWI